MEKVGKVIYDVSTLTDYDIYLFKQGNNFRLHEKLGAHLRNINGVDGTHFAVWAPNARSVSVVGDFNGWNAHSHSLKAREDGSGIWEGFIAGLARANCINITLLQISMTIRSIRPTHLRFLPKVPPHTASVIWDLEYEWKDDEWLKNRHKHNSRQSPISIYEVHPGSWQRTSAAMTAENLSAILELADQLGDYVKDMGFTHVELTPVMEHPYYPSWGYQCSWLFCPDKPLRHIRRI